MQPSDRADFARLLTDVMAYYRQDISPFTLDLWWGACQAFEMPQVRRAMTSHATDPDRGQFAPKVADLVRALTGTRTDAAQLAWGKAFDAAGRVGAYTDVVFDDPAIHAALEDLGGWPKFCRTETSELSYLQHRFCESYKAYAGRERFDYPRRLTADRSPDDLYAKRGLPPPKPAVIGDVERARAVYRGGMTGGKTSVMYQALEAIERGPALIGDKPRAAA
jgi:hypothetical protein